MICDSAITAIGSKAEQKSHGSNSDLHTTAEQASQPHDHKGDPIGRAGGLPAEGRLPCGISLRGWMKAQRLFLQALFSGSTTPERLFPYPTKERAVRSFRLSRLCRDNSFPQPLAVAFPFFPVLLVVHDPTYSLQPTQTSSLPREAGIEGSSSLFHTVSIRLGYSFTRTFCEPSAPSGNSVGI